MSVPVWPLLSALALLSLTLAFVAHLCARAVLARDIPKSLRQPPISILKPLKGVDDGLYLNLVSFAKLDYRNYEVICGAEDAADPALEVARRVQREFPHIQFRVLQCRGHRGKNPKVRSLQALAAEAKHPYLLISDSNVRVDATWLRDTAAELSDPRVGLVTNPIAPIDKTVNGQTESLGALFENLHLGAFVLGAVALPKVVADRACVIGKSMLMSRAALHDLGGFRAVRNVLAEDYLLGRKFELAGYRVVLSPRCVQTVNQSWTLERFYNRHLRWGQMRRRISLAAYVSELLLNPVPWIAAAFFARAENIYSNDGCGSELLCSFAVAIAAVAFKCALDIRLMKKLRHQPLPLLDSIWIPMKDLFIAAIWPIALVKRTLDWRGNPLRIGRVSRLFAVSDAEAKVGEAA